MDAIDEVKSLKERQERLSSEAMLSALKRSAAEEELALEEEDEAAVSHHHMLPPEHFHLNTLGEG